MAFVPLFACGRRKGVVRLAVSGWRGVPGAVVCRPSCPPFGGGGGGGAVISPRCEGGPAGRLAAARVTGGGVCPPLHLPPWAKGVGLRLLVTPAVRGGGPG